MENMKEVVNAMKDLVTAFESIVDTSKKSPEVPEFDSEKLAGWGVIDNGCDDTTTAPLSAKYYGDALFDTIIDSIVCDITCDGSNEFDQFINNFQRIKSLCNDAEGDGVNVIDMMGIPLQTKSILSLANIGLSSKNTSQATMGIYGYILANQTLFIEMSTSIDHELVIRNIVASDKLKDACNNVSPTLIELIFRVLRSVNH